MLLHDRSLRAAQDSEVVANLLADFAELLLEIRGRFVEELARLSLDAATDVDEDISVPHLRGHDVVHAPLHSRAGFERAVTVGAEHLFEDVGVIVIPGSIALDRAAVTCKHADIAFIGKVSGTCLNFFIKLSNASARRYCTSLSFVFMIFTKRAEPSSSNIELAQRTQRQVTRSYFGYLSSADGAGPQSSLSMLQ